MNQGWDIIMILSALHSIGNSSQESRGELVVKEEHKCSTDCDHLGHLPSLPRQSNVRQKIIFRY